MLLEYKCSQCTHRQLGHLLWLVHAVERGRLHRPLWKICTVSLCSCRWFCFGQGPGWKTQLNTVTHLYICSPPDWGWSFTCAWWRCWALWENQGEKVGLVGPNPTVTLVAGELMPGRWGTWGSSTKAPDVSSIPSHFPAHMTGLYDRVSLHVY